MTDGQGKGRRREAGAQHALTTPFLKQRWLIDHIARPFLEDWPLMSEWNTMLMYLFATLIAVAPPGPAVPKLPLCARKNCQHDVPRGEGRQRAAAYLERKGETFLKVALSFLETAYLTSYPSVL